MRKSRASLKLRFLHQFRKGDSESSRNLDERADSDVVVAPFYPSKVTPINFGAKRQIFLGNPLRRTNSADRLPEGE